MDNNSYVENRVKFFYRFCFYSKVILIPIGIIGNIISMCIFTRPSFNQKTNIGILYTLFCGINLITIVYEAAFKYKNSFTKFCLIYCTLFYAGIEIGLPSPYYELLSTFLPLFSFFYLTLIFLLFILFNRIFRAEFITLFRLQKIFKIVTSTNH